MSISDFRVGVLRGGCLLLFSFGLLLTSTGCSKGPAPADPAISGANQWIRFLATGDPPKRIQAVTELGKMRNKSAVDPILRVAVKDHQIPVRVAALEALGQPGLLDEKQIQSVVLQLTSPESEVRMAACRALGAIKEPVAIESLLQCMYDRDSAVRLTAVDALGKFGPLVLTNFVAIFQTGSSDQKAMIATVLGKGGDPVYQKLLETGLRDDDDLVRRTCAESLGLLKQASAVPALVALLREPLSPKRIQEHRDRVRQRPNEYDYSIMIKHLDEECIRKNIRTDPARYPWIRSGTHTNLFAKAIEVGIGEAAAIVRSCAIDAIVKLAPPDLDSILIGILAEQEPGAGALASKALRERGAAALPLLVATVEDTKAPALARVRAIDTIAPLPPAVRKDDTDKLRDLMRQQMEGDGEDMPSSSNPSNVVIVLPPETLKLFLALQSDADPKVRSAAAIHLGRAAIKEAVAPLLDSFRTTEMETAQKAVAALAPFRDERIAPVLIAALADPKYSAITIPIINTLGAVGDKRAAAPLLKLALAADGDLPTRDAAIEALGRIADPSTFAPMMELTRQVHAQVYDLSKRKSDDKVEAEKLRGQVSAMGQLENKAIRFFGETKAREAVDMLTEFLWETNRVPNIQGILLALGQIGDPKVVGSISKFISKAGWQKWYHSRTYQNYKTAAGIDALVAIGDPGGIEVLKYFAANWQDPADSYTGKYAIDAMGRMKHPDAVAVLVNYLKDPAVDPVMKDSCIGRALAAAGTVAKEPLLKILKESPKPGEHALTDPGMYAAQILGVLTKPDVNIIPDLSAILDAKPPSYIVQRVTESIAQTHHEAGVRLLAKLAKSDEVTSRQMAVLALGKIKLRSAVPVLDEALKDADQRTRECAALSLREYGVATAAEKKE